MPKTTLPNISTHEFEEVPYMDLMKKRIYNVLIICSNYDFYLLQEDGRIDGQIFDEYMELNLRYPPSFFHAYSVRSALKKLKTVNIDLVITWLDTSKSSIKIANEIKKIHPEIPIAALGHYSSELRKILNQNKSSAIDFVFHWNGNTDIFLAIIKLVEDRMNSEVDISQIGVKAILLVEDSLKFYSNYIPLIYKIILNQTRSFIQEGLNEHFKMMSRRGRPKILLATTYEEGIELFKKYKNNLLGAISDVTYFKDGVQDKQAGFNFYHYVKERKKYFPVIIQSSDIKNRDKALNEGAKFIYKHSETLGLDLKEHIMKYFSFGDFHFYDPNTRKHISRIKNLKQFQTELMNVPTETLVYHAKRNDFSKWLQSRALFPLANLFSQIDYNSFWDGDEVRDFIIKSVRAFRISRSRGIIAHFNKKNYDEYLIFSRIGQGSLGGKGRGLAFIDSFLKRHKKFLHYEDVQISIPRTVVISTDVFDQFMENHDLFRFVTKADNDETILHKFISLPLPKWAVRDIKHFLSTIKTPIAIRSSSVLEDSLYQPFAGIFSTYMIPNSDLDTTLKQVLKAIKAVIASAFYKNSKAYIKATAYSFEESKMAVILQEVIGKTYDDIYFPNISGVARSLNFYPLGNEKTNEGIANIALGLGEIIVGGGKTLRFSPYHPKTILQLSNPETALKQTQKYFFALDMDPKSFKISTSEAINKKKIKLRKAKNHPALKYVASTFDHQNNMIRPGVQEKGMRVLTFDNVLKYNSFPLAEILQQLLKIGQREMQAPIEIEFAVKLDVPKDEPKVFSFLQIRPIVNTYDIDVRIPKKFDLEDTIIYSESALGMGNYEGLSDIVYVKPQAFNKAKTIDIALSVERVNSLFDDDRKYILIGPGRWGSSDPWLGIPVTWSQISSAKIIIESGLEDYRIDPSQGTHFFQNLTSFKVGYLTINPYIEDGYFDLEYLDKQEVIFEDEFIKHVKFKKDLKILIDGKNNKALIFKEGIIPENENDIKIDESAPSGFE